MSTPPRLTPKTRELVAVDRLDRAPVGTLTAAHVEALVAVARRPRAFAEQVSAPRAIRALARGAKANVAIPVLAEIVSDQAAPAFPRVVAARELGLIGTPEAEQALLRRVAIRDPRVQQAVIWGIGALGGPAALRKLDGIAVPDDPATRRQLALARALIAHRHALEGAFLPAVKGVVRRPQDMELKTALTLQMKTEKATASDVARLTGSTYGIELAERAAALTCGRVEWTLFFNRELGLSAIAQRLFERPWIAALLGRWHVEGKAAVTQHVLLTRADGGSAHIDVVRTDGERMYTGRAERDGNGFTFSIADIDRPGMAPTNVTGRLGPKGIELAGVIASGRRIAVRVPKPVNLG
jgi:hypothetical protein